MPATILPRLSLVFVSLFSSTSLRNAEGAEAAEFFFETKVRPILIARCYECHSQEADEASGGLRVDTSQSLRSGGSRGPAILPGDSRRSLLMTAVRYEDAEIQMPPDDKLSEAEIAVLHKWIESGAFDPRQAVSSAGAEPKTDWREHWALQLPEHASIETIDSRCTDPIDAAAIQRMVADGIEPANQTDRATWLRRIYFDLIGLPPSIDQISRFVQSPRPNARQRVIDELLARPEFGERWGRHWLDVARYADTVGYRLENKPTRLEGSERYRDWVINSFNEDVPFDRQVVLQLAADRMDPANESGDLDAMGFLTIGRHFLSRDDTIDDQIDVISRGLLGMTVQCARCHDHKFDPIPTMDYYALVGVMTSSVRRDDAPSPLALFDAGKPHDHPVWIRGQRGNRGPIAPRQFLTALRRPNTAKFSRGSGRLDLAEAIVDDANPLFRRVITNRVWMHLMQRPIVPTPSDFGVRTERPVQVAVLDDLATEFASDKSLKRMIRRLTCTSLYGQTIETSEDQIRADPDNKYFSRQNPRRRDFESLRDSVLAVSDNLDRRFGGVPISITEHPTPPRRTVYAFIDRQEIPGVLRAFDVADPNAHSPMRYETTVPMQSLFLLNSPFLLDAARMTTRSALRSHGLIDLDSVSQAQMIVALFERILQRQPTAGELAATIEFLGDLAPAGHVAQPSHAAWTYGYGQLLRDQSSVNDFQRFPVFGDGRWGGGKLPDAAIGWTSLSAGGGHPGSRLAAVRRWTAPQSGHVEIRGRLRHPAKPGDGVRMSILSAGKRLVALQSHNDAKSFGPIHTNVAAGQIIDFAVDCNDGVTHDSFESAINIRLVSDDLATIEFDAVADFRGDKVNEAPNRLSRLEQLAQTLLLSNEFMFVE